ncbi:transposable element Tcb2 transposase [Trichonephila clavipes]|nr:transposable element Tcb2 transposase [Trichonephila clavipes]
MSSNYDSVDGASHAVSKQTLQRLFHRIGFGSRRPTRVPLLNARFRAALLIRARERRQAREAMDPACQVRIVQGHCGSVMIWDVYLGHCLGSLVRVPTSLNEIRYVELLGDHFYPLMLFCYPHGVKGHHTEPMNLTALGSALAIICQVIPVEHFQKLVESVPCREEAVIKAI